ncbi:hypothetical protein [Metabacillus sediminilitoris]|uniref:hypothetical protein n=1 Tax=Metabacillus sediminilitoris TaxID=2567941 RepID=UPI0012D79D5C|nr:hypothetical protein [Metabacillus sediminilitoris]QGQ44854.1 hypothetical protein GMB29_05995 [Metabacillus sediminilitoris]
MRLYNSYSIKGRDPGTWISVRFSFLGPVEKQRRNNTNIGIIENKMTNDYKEMY